MLKLEEWLACYKCQKKLNWEVLKRSENKICNRRHSTIYCENINECAKKYIDLKLDSGGGE